jgi:hypothetical protein
VTAIVTASGCGGPDPSEWCTEDHGYTEVLVPNPVATPPTHAQIARQLPTLGIGIGIGD